MRALSAWSATIRAVLSCIAASYAASQPLLAQPRAQSRDVTLQAALDAALSASPRLLLERRSLEASRGEWLQAAAPFDLNLRTSVSSQRENTLSPPGPAAPQASYLAMDALEYRLDAEKQLRSGIVISPSVSVVQSRQLATGSAPNGIAAAGLSIAVPLLNNRGGSVVGAAERASEIRHDAGVYDVRFAAAEVAREVVGAYWSYRASYDRLAIYAAAEERAQRMADETARLVEVDERPASDLKQLHANAAAKRAARLLAEQRIAEARRVLGLAIGLSTAEIEALAIASTPFPVATVDDWSDDRADQYLARAASERADLVSGVRRRDASRIEFEASLKDLSARIDLSASIGYQGYAQRWGLNGLLSPLHQNTSGVNGGVQLTYQLPVTNALARGRMRHREALYRQHEIGLDDTQRRITSGVLVAWQSVKLSHASLDESRRSVTLYEETVVNEQTKFRLGTSTLFDVIAAEDALTNARLTEVNGQLGHATAIADLRFATGTIVVTRGRDFVARAGDVMTLPN